MTDETRGSGMDMSFRFGTGREGGTPPEYRPLPLRILAMANFRGCPAKREPQIFSVDKDNIDKLPARLGVDLFFEVDNHLGSKDPRLEIRASLEGLDDLTPEKLAARIPALDPVRKLLSELRAVSDGSMERSRFESGLGVYDGVPALQEAIGKTLKTLRGEAPVAKPVAPAPKPAEGKPSGGGVFDLVDVGEPEPEPAKPTDAPKRSAIGSLIAGIGGGAKAQDKGPDLKEAIASAQAVMDRQLSAVLHHQQFREVEAAWRGLKLLTSHCNFRGNTRLEILDAEKDGASDVFSAKVYEREYAGLSEVPLSLLVLDYSFENTAADLSILSEFADMGEAIQTPTVVSMGGGFCGMPDELARHSHPAARFEEADFAKWRSLREAQNSRWLCAAYNRVLLRAPWRPGKRGASGCTESVSSAADLAWGNPGWCVASLVARSFSETGWPTSITGLEHGEVSSLPVWTGDREDEQFGPVETRFSERHVGDLAGVGLSVLTAQPNHDGALLVRAPSIHRPGVNEPKGRNSVAYQLLAARLGETLMANRTRLEGDGSPQTIKANFQSFLSGLLGDTGPGAAAEVQVGVDPRHPERAQVAVRLRTGRTVLGGVEFEMAMNL